MNHRLALRRQMAVVVASAALGVSATCAAANRGTENESLRSLAAKARATLVQRVEPPIAQLPFLCIKGRTQGRPMREVLLQQQARAIDALVASAETPAVVEHVRRLLQDLQRSGSSSKAESWLRETIPGTTGLLLAASLGELPAALHERVHPGCPGIATYSGLHGRTGLPLGGLAHSDYEQISSGEPRNPWHPLILAWVSGSSGQEAIRQSLKLSQHSSFPDAQRVNLYAWQQLAWVQGQQGHKGDAQAAAMEAIRLARDAVQRAQSGTAVAEATRALLDEAFTTVAMARVLEEAGAGTAALDLLKAIEPSLRHMADSVPNDLPIQIAYIDALGQMGGADSRFVSEALTRYEALQSRTPYDSMYTQQTVPGILTSATAISGVFTFLFSSVLLWRYRRRIASLMRQVARSTGREAEESPMPAASFEPGMRDGFANAVAEAKRSHRHAAAVQVGAGLTFGLFACFLELDASGVRPNINRVLILTWAWAWPTVLALGFIWDGDRRRKLIVWAAYLAGLLLICTRVEMSDTPPLEHRSPFVQGLFIWASTLAYSPFLLLFLNRTLRSIGPVVLAIMLVVTGGGMLALTAFSTPAGLKSGVTALSALSVPVNLMLPTVALIGMLVCVPFAWAVGWLLRELYAARWISDQSLMVDAIWLFQASQLSMSMYWNIGGDAVGLGFAAFALYKTVSLVAMWPIARGAGHRASLRLLMLRVFSRRDAKGRRMRGRSDMRLYDLLNTRWRYAGPLCMIGAPDLATTTLNPHSLLDFMAGHLRQRFIVHPSEVPSRVAQIDERCDLDARWRVNELYCGDTAWRTAVLALMERSDFVAMDLRNFRPGNDGCVFELHALLDIVPESRIALLVDGTTDRAFLEETLAQRLDYAETTSSIVEISVLEIISRKEGVAIDALLRQVERLEQTRTGLGVAPSFGSCPAVALLLVVTNRGAVPVQRLHAIIREKGGTVGRSSQCTLVLADAGPSISRIHARITFRRGEWFVMLEGHSAGLRVNEVAAVIEEPIRLRPGDIIHVGVYEIEVRLAHSNAVVS